ncbi:MAG TPA: 2'-5' RNA ligase family protein [Flavobacterium sp.]
MKDLLKSKVPKNWYNSCNSEAHITICEFTIDDSKLDFYKQKLLKIANTFIPFQVSLNSFGSFPASNAFFIAPDHNSKIKLESIMKKTQNALKPLKMYKSSEPHMSIGRKLTPENLKIASELFTTIDLKFLCDQIVLREFDPVKKQFFVIDTFKFGSNPEPEFVQGSLF